MINNGEGFIVLKRKLLEWRWHDNMIAFSFWIYLLLKANWKPAYFKGKLIPRGSFATSYETMSKETKLAKNTIRKWIKVFQEDGQIEVNSTHEYTVIKVTNYAKYQDVPHYPDMPIDTPTDTPIDTQVDTRVDTPLEPDRTRITRITNKDIYSWAENDREVGKQVIDYLNEQTGKSFHYTESNLKFIKARMNDGYNLEDFKTVIDKKCKEWKNDSKMQKYLRPETLFNATKFEGYLNQQEVQGKEMPSYYEKIKDVDINFDDLPFGNE